MANRQATCAAAGVVNDPNAQEFEKLLKSPTATTQPLLAQRRIEGVRIGTLVGFANGGATPLVTYADQLVASPAQATLDLHAAHIGMSAVLVFDDGDPSRPIILGCLRHAE